MDRNGNKIVVQQGGLAAEAFEAKPRLWQVYYPTGGEQLIGTEAQVRRAMRMRMAADHPAEEVPLAPAVVVPRAELTDA